MNWSGTVRSDRLGATRIDASLHKLGPYLLGLLGKESAGKEDETRDTWAFVAAGQEDQVPFSLVPARMSCRGDLTGTGKTSPGSFEGTFEGSDCRGAHRDGQLSLSGKVAAGASPVAAQPGAEPAKTDPGADIGGGSAGDAGAGLVGNELPGPEQAPSGIHGAVVDPEGKPAAGVRVTAFLVREVETTGSPLDWRLDLEPRFIRGTETDSAGRFDLEYPEPGRYHVALEAPDGKGAWLPDVKFDGRPVPVGTASLAPLGTVAGESRETDVPDLTGLFAFVPSSPYRASTDKDGTFALRLPAGSFTLVVADPDFGPVGSTTSVMVKPSETTAARVKLDRPTVEEVFAEDGETVPAYFVPGETCVVKGSNFRAGALAWINDVEAFAHHDSDTRLHVMLPPGLAWRVTGPAALRVRNGRIVSAASVPVRIYAKLVRRQEVVKLARGGTFDLHDAVAAVDTEGKAIATAPLDFGVSPGETYVSGVVSVTSEGVVTGLAAGSAMWQVFGQLGEMAWVEIEVAE